MIFLDTGQKGRDTGISSDDVEDSEQIVPDVDSNPATRVENPSDRLDVVVPSSAPAGHDDDLDPALGQDDDLDPALGVAYWPGDTYRARRRSRVLLGPGPFHNDRTGGGY